MEVAVVGSDGIDVREAEPGEVDAEGDAYAWAHFADPDESDVGEALRSLGWGGFDADAGHGNRSRARLETSGDAVMLVVKTVQYAVDTRQIETGELAVYTDGRALVTARYGGADPVPSARERLADDAELRGEGVSAAVWAVLREVVDGYDTAVEDVAEDIAALERKVFSGGRSDLIGDIYFLIRETVEFQNAVQPLAPLAHLIREKQSGLPVFEGRRQRGIAGHLLRVDSSVESCMNLLTTVLAAHQGQIGVWQNEDMRRISAWAGIALVPTVIAGIYGMNFRHMPELHWIVSYPLILLVMAAICLLLYRGFKRNGWL